MCSLQFMLHPFKHVSTPTKWHCFTLIRRQVEIILEALSTDTSKKQANKDIPFSNSLNKIWFQASINKFLKSLYFLLAEAVHFNPVTYLSQIRASQKVTKPQRETMLKYICSQKLQIATGFRRASKEFKLITSM
jgi:hypothetical protein